MLCRRCLQEGAAAFFVTGGRSMRLDKYLKVSRLIKRRTVANEVADAGRILINGKIAKASQAVKAGDIIEVTFGNRPIKVKVLSDVEPRTKDVAREMYEIIAEGEQA
jgi:ribosomal 50S subunit-recycling heat shock protein